MFKFKAPIMSILIIMFSSCLLFAVTGGGGINENQPISIGEYIYKKWSDTGYGIYSREYIYAGIENNNIKIETAYSTPDGVTRNALSLPLNENKKALLKMQTDNLKDTLTVVITVIDEFSRIKVEQQIY